MYELFMWLDSIYQGLNNPLLMFLMLMGYIAVGSGIGFFIAYILNKIDDCFFWHF